MFCSNCGKEINENQKFCRYCGTKNEDEFQSNSLNNEILNNTQFQQVNTVFDRNVLNNYMYNIRTLEVVKNELLVQKQNVLYRISNLGYRQNMYEPSTDGESIMYALFGGGGFIVAVLVIGTLLKETIGEWLDWTDFFSGLMTLLIIGTIVIAGGYIIYELYSAAKSKEDYFYRKKQDEIRVENELKEKSALEEIAGELDEEIIENDKLINEAYSVNLIPSKYRNVYAAYFLYDYISTSTATLSEALLHCDLDTIIEKLESVIEQQSEMIMELAASNAKNEVIIRQNEQMLQHAIQTENNTALAAQYSQIAATNSKVTAYCQMVQFLEK